MICAGAYSNFFAREFGDKVLLEAERGYHLVIPDPGITLGRSLTYVKTPMAMTPMDVGLRLAGTQEVGWSLLLDGVVEQVVLAQQEAQQEAPLVHRRGRYLRPS